MFKRMYYHANRFRGSFLYASVLLLTLVVMMTAFYPGEEGIVAYSEYITEAGFAVILGAIGTSASGFVFWIGMQINIYLYYIIVITGLLMGSKLFPTTDEDNVELLIGGSSISCRTFYLENLISALTILFLSIIPSFVATILYTYHYQSEDIIGRIAITYFFVFSIGVFYLVLSSLASIIWFSKSAGKKVGFGYLIYSFLIELQAGSSEEAAQIAQTSMNYYVDAASGLITGDFDWNPIIVLYILVLVFAAASYIIVKKKQFIQKAPKPVKTRHGLSKIIAPESRVSQKFPIFMEQLRSDLGFFVGWIIMLTLILFYMPNIAPADEDLMGFMGAFDIPFMDALTLGYTMEYTYIGFISIEFYGLLWFYFAAFYVFVAASIATREVRKQSQDLLLGNNLSTTKIVLQRTIVMLIEITIMVWLSYLVLVLAETSLDKKVDNTIRLNAFIIIWIHSIASSILFTAISMIPRIGKGRTLAIWVYLYSILVLILAYSAESLEFLKYTSIWLWGNTVGILYEKVEFTDVLLNNVIYLAISIVLFFAMLKYRYKKADFV